MLQLSQGACVVLLIACTLSNALIAADTSSHFRSNPYAALVELPAGLSLKFTVSSTKLS